MDHYGRIVARVLRQDGSDVAQLMVAKGFALASTRYTRDYARAEKIARTTHSGFWRMGGVQDGADYRRRK